MYTLIEVTTRQHETDFLELPVRLYKGNPWWIRPLETNKPGDVALEVEHLSGMYSILRKILVSKMANVSAGF